MDYTVVGIVVNPKLKQPVLVLWEGDEIEIWSLARGGGRVGMGSYESGDPSYEQPANITGMPRVHTPSGVKPKGKGYGTSLYTALCLGAHQHHENELDIEVEWDGDGVSSDADTRSPAASAWWNQAVRLRLAEEIEDEYTEEDVDIDPYDLDCSHSDGEVEIRSAMGDITKTQTVNAYPYDNAERSDLIVASIVDVEIREAALVDRVAGKTRDSPVVRLLSPGGLRSLWKEAIDRHTVMEVDRDALLALDVRGLEPQAVNLLSTIAMLDGVSDKDIGALRMRAELNLDPATPIRQMSLPFTPNPAEKRQIRSMLEETKQLRDSLDWKRLSQLP